MFSKLFSLVRFMVYNLKLNQAKAQMVPLLGPNMVVHVYLHLIIMINFVLQ